MTKREIALSYLEKGLSVIPLKSPTTVKRSTKFKEKVLEEFEANVARPNPRAEEDIYEEMFNKECKKPLLAWKQYQERLPTKEEVNSWFNMNPDANIGIITGAVSNLVVFDLDSEHAVEYAEEQGGFPDSVKVKTGRGYHIYMRHPGFIVKNQVEEKLDIDIRGDGGLVVAPPSVHGSGHQYKWEGGFSIFEVDPAECTPWMIDYLKCISAAEVKPETEGKKDTPKETKKKEPADKTQNEGDKKGYADIIAKGCVKGNRNDTTIRLVGHLLKTGPKEETWELVKLWNEHKNKPPLPHDDLKDIFEYVFNMEQKGKVTADSFLDSADSALAEYNQNYVRIPIAGQTSLHNLEKVMNGGLAGGRFYIFGGIPSSGKTVLLNNIADNICLNGYPVIFFSYDDGKAELRHRTLSRFSDFGIEDYNLKRIPDLKYVLNGPSIKQILSLKYIIQEMIPVEKWSDLVEQIKKMHGKGPVIIVDYLRKMKTNSKITDERLRVDDIIGKLTQLAKDQNIPVVAISELARDSYRSGQRLSMASFKESGSIEYEASWLGILAAVEEGKNGEYILKDNWENIIEHDGNIDLIIFKAKRGTGYTGKVPLKVDKNSMTVNDRPVESATKQTPKNPIKTKY